jgi:hypothetical protein
MEGFLMYKEMEDRGTLFKWRGGPADDEEIEYMSTDENRKFVRGIMEQARQASGRPSDPKMEDTGTTIYLNGNRLKVMRNSPGKDAGSKD